MQKLKVSRFFAISKVPARPSAGIGVVEVQKRSCLVVRAPASGTGGSRVRFLPGPRAGVARCNLHFKATCAEQVALRKLHCASCSAQDAPRKLLLPASGSLQVALCKLRSLQVALCKLLCASCSVQVALCKLFCFRANRGLVFFQKGGGESASGGAKGNEVSFGVGCETVAVVVCFLLGGRVRGSALGCAKGKGLLSSSSSLGGARRGRGGESALGGEGGRMSISFGGREGERMSISFGGRNVNTAQTSKFALRRKRTKKRTPKSTSERHFQRSLLKQFFAPKRA